MKKNKELSKINKVQIFKSIILISVLYIINIQNIVFANNALETIKNENTLTLTQNLIIILISFSFVLILLAIAILLRIKELKRSNDIIERFMRERNYENYR